MATGPTVHGVRAGQLAGHGTTYVEFMSRTLPIRSTSVCIGGSSVPIEVERYTLKDNSHGDVAAVATALSDEPIALVGHDWGAADRVEYRDLVTPIGCTRSPV